VASISLSPNSFFANFSAANLITGNIYDSELTEPAFLNLFGRQGKHREYFHHYFHDDIGHYRSGRDHRIDLQTFEEAPQALKEVEERIVA
jgi:hypothetical protein